MQHLAPEHVAALGELPALKCGASPLTYVDNNPGLKSGVSSFAPRAYFLIFGFTAAFEVMSQGQTRIIIGTRRKTFECSTLRQNM